MLQNLNVLKKTWGSIAGFSSERDYNITKGEKKRFWLFAHGSWHIVPKTLGISGMKRVSFVYWSNWWLGAARSLQVCVWGVAITSGQWLNHSSLGNETSLGASKPQFRKLREVCTGEGVGVPHTTHIPSPCLYISSLWMLQNWILYNKLGI